MVNRGWSEKVKHAMSSQSSPDSPARNPMTVGPGLGGLPPP